jgi:hypothetical protein
MSTIDLDALVQALDPHERGGRRNVDDVAAAIRGLVPHTDPAVLPELVKEVLRRGGEQGRWSVTRTATIRYGATTLPKAIMLPSTTRPAKLVAVGVPLRSELAPWAATLKLSSSQRRLLLAVNDWLRRTDGGKVPVVAAAERAYELIGDEKAFDSNPPRGGMTLWGSGKLTFELVRCERVPTPLTWEPTTTIIGGPGPIVCVENHATFRTLLRVLRLHDAPQWAAVAWVQGRNTAPLEAIRDLPFTATRMDYLGDLDPAGLAIAATACDIATGIGVPAWPAARLWELLAAQPARSGPRMSEADARGLAHWLPESLHKRAIDLFTAGQRIPQEALRFDLLADVLLETDHANAKEHADDGW